MRSACSLFMPPLPKNLGDYQTARSHPEVMAAQGVFSAMVVQAIALAKSAGRAYSAEDLDALRAKERRDLIQDGSLGLLGFLPPEVAAEWHGDTAAFMPDIVDVTKSGKDSRRIQQRSGMVRYAEMLAGSSECLFLKRKAEIIMQQRRRFWYLKRECLLLLTSNHPWYQAFECGLTHPSVQLVECD